jgi:hypothetical protein
VASKSLVEWLKILWENWRESAWSQMLLCLVLCPDLSPAAGSSSPFYRPRRERITCMLHYLGTCGMLCRRVGGRLDGPCRDPAIMAYLVLEQW